MVTTPIHCLNHPKNECKYWLFTDNFAWGFCQECYKWLGKVHQLVIIDGKKEQKDMKNNLSTLKEALKKEFREEFPIDAQDEGLRASNLSLND